MTFPKYTRYVDDAADMARVIRGEKASDFPYEHDLAVQEALLKACGLPPTCEPRGASARRRTGGTHGMPRSVIAERARDRYR